MSDNVENHVYTMEEALCFLFSRPGHQMFQGIDFLIKVETPTGHVGEVYCLLQKSLPPREFVVPPAAGSVQLQEVIIVQILEVPRKSSRRQGLATQFLKELIEVSWKKHQIEGIIIQCASTPAIHGLMSSLKTKAHGKWVFKGEWLSPNMGLGDYFFVQPCFLSQMEGRNGVYEQGLINWDNIE